MSTKIPTFTTKLKKWSQKQKLFSNYCLSLFYLYANHRHWRSKTINPIPIINLHIPYLYRCFISKIIKIMSLCMMSNDTWLIWLKNRILLSEKLYKSKTISQASIWCLTTHRCLNRKSQSNWTKYLLMNETGLSVPRKSWTCHTSWNPVNVWA